MAMQDDRAAAHARLAARVEAARVAGSTKGRRQAQAAQAAAPGARDRTLERAAHPSGDAFQQRLRDQQRSLQRRVQGVSVWEKEMGELRAENQRLKSGGGGGGGKAGGLAAIALSVESQLSQSATRMSEHSSPRKLPLSSPARRSVAEIDRSRALVREVEQLNEQLQLSVTGKLDYPSPPAAPEAEAEEAEEERQPAAGEPAAADEEIPEAIEAWPEEQPVDEAVAAAEAAAEAVAGASAAMAVGAAAAVAATEAAATEAAVRARDAAAALAAEQTARASAAARAEQAAGALAAEQAARADAEARLFALEEASTESERLAESLRSEASASAERLRGFEASYAESAAANEQALRVNEQTLRAQLAEAQEARTAAEVSQESEQARCGALLAELDTLHSKSVEVTALNESVTSKLDTALSLSEAATADARTQRDAAAARQAVAEAAAVDATAALAVEQAACADSKVRLRAAEKVSIESEQVAGGLRLEISAAATASAERLRTFEATHAESAALNTQQSEGAHAAMSSLRSELAAAHDARAAAVSSQESEQARCDKMLAELHAEIESAAEARRQRDAEGATQAVTNATAAAALAAEEAARADSERRLCALQDASTESERLADGLRVELAAASQAGAERLRAVEAKYAESATVTAQQSEDVRAAMSSLRTALAVAVSSHESLLAELNALRGKSTEVAGELSSSQAAAAEACRQRDAAVASQAAAEAAAAADATARTAAAATTLAAEQAGRADAEAANRSLAEQLSELRVAMEQIGTETASQPDSQPDSPPQGDVACTSTEDLSPGTAAETGALNTEPTQQQRLPKTLSWGANQTHEIHVTQSEKDDKRDTFRRIMDHSDEEQREIHEEILALRQQLGQPAATVPSYATGTAARRQGMTSEEAISAGHSGGSEEPLPAAEDQLLLDEAKLQPQPVAPPVAQVIEMESPGLKPMGQSRQMELRAADGTRFFVAAPDVDAGTSLRLVVPPPGEAAAPAAAGASTLSAVEQTTRGTGAPAVSGGSKRSAGVDAELSETEAMVAQMKAELGLGSGGLGTPTAPPNNDRG